MACVEIKMARSSKIHKEKTPQHKREGKKKWSTALSIQRNKLTSK